MMSEWYEDTWNESYEPPGALQIPRALEEHPNLLEETGSKPCWSCVSFQMALWQEISYSACCSPIDALNDQSLHFLICWPEWIILDLRRRRQKYFVRGIKLEVENTEILDLDLERVENISYVRNTCCMNTGVCWGHNSSPRRSCDMLLWQDERRKPPAPFPTRWEPHVHWESAVVTSTSHPRLSLHDCFLPKFLIHHCYTRTSNFTALILDRFLRFGGHNAEPWKRCWEVLLGQNDSSKLPWTPYIYQDPQFKNQTRISESYYLCETTLYEYLISSTFILWNILNLGRCMLPSNVLPSLTVSGFSSHLRKTFMADITSAMQRRAGLV